MLDRYRIVRRTARRIAGAAETAIEAYREGRIKDEPRITDRMLGAIEQAMKEYADRGVTWTSMTLQPGKGQAAEEKRHGADFMGVLDIALPDFTVQTGFLAQAKRLEPPQSLHSGEWDRLNEQCETMLRRTPAAFVFLYSKPDISIVPAISVAGLQQAENMFGCYSVGVQSFFERHIESFIGDRRLSRAAIDVLDQLAAEYEVRRLLYLQARETEDYVREF